MRQENVVAAAWILVVAAAVAAAAAPGSSGQPVEGVFTTGSGNVTLTLEVADSPEEWERGLMERQRLAENHGMLFVFPGERRRVFWMKNTYIPLDIIFIDAHGQVINVEQATPEPGVPEDELTLYRSDAPAKYVVEVNQGFAEKNGIGPGSQFSFQWR
ncbi:MAG: DUF192 domain-containing protein [Candidatus Nanohaloarchaea archaeon]